MLTLAVVSNQENGKFRLFLYDSTSDDVLIRLLIFVLFVSQLCNNLVSSYSALVHIIIFSSSSSSRARKTNQFRSRFRYYSRK